MASKPKALTKATAAAPAHGTDELSRSESLAVETAESYDPANDADWTAIGAAPTAQDAALDALASAAADAINGGVQWTQATYDFSVDGGAVSTIDLGVSIPDAATVLYSTVRVDTAITAAGGGTIQFNLPVDGALSAAIPDGTAAGQQDGAQDWSAANSLATTAARSISVDIAVAPLTTGKATIYVAYAL